jgi:hypothetical protein
MHSQLWKPQEGRACSCFSCTQQWVNPFRKRAVLSFCGLCPLELAVLLWTNPPAIQVCGQNLHVAQVWDERDQPQILQVQPFLPHSNKEMGEMTALHDRVKQVRPSSTPIIQHHPITQSSNSPILFCVCVSEAHSNITFRKGVAMRIAGPSTDFVDFARPHLFACNNPSVCCACVPMHSNRIDQAFDLACFFACDLVAALVVRSLC